MMIKVSVVIPARNEEKNLPIVLKNLFLQKDVKLRVIVVDDGSKDNTSKVAREMGAEVIRLEDRGYEAHGTPHLAEVINSGLKKVDECDYVMILGADHVLPQDYLEKITGRMEEDSRIALASGIIKGEKAVSPWVRGSGRVVRVSWWRKYGLQYPLNYGWEAWLIYRALKDGLKSIVYSDIVTEVLRPTGRRARQYYYWGKGMRALNYYPLYATVRIVSLLLHNPKYGFYMAAGYLSKTEKIEDIADFVPRYQKEVLKKKLKKILRLD